MLEVKNLFKVYDDRPVLSNLSFSAAPGEIFGFCGANGSGKTTTLRIVMGLVPHDSGEVRWKGVPLDGERRKRIGYMPSERGLFPKMRPQAHLELLARLAGVPDDQASDRASFWMERMQIQTHANATIEQLSLGNQQRLQFAAALINDPELLLLDEPFSGLDSAGIDLLTGILRERTAAGTPVIVSSHQIDVIERVCDSIGVLTNGRMALTGQLASLRAMHETTRLSITLHEAPPAGWAQSLPHAEEIREDGATVRLSPVDIARRNEILSAAMQHGLVDRFVNSVRPFSEIIAEASTLDLPRRAAPESLAEMSVLPEDIPEPADGVPGDGRHWRDSDD